MTRTLWVGIAILTSLAGQLGAQKRSATRHRAAAGPDTTALQTQCSAGKSDACTSMAWLLMVGKPLAAAYYTRACQNNELTACVNLGSLTAQGRGVTRDPVRAARFFAQACDGDLAAGCVNLAVANRRGIGVPRDTPRARELFAKACRLGDATACRLAQRP